MHKIFFMISTSLGGAKNGSKKGEWHRDRHFSWTHIIIGMIFGHLWLASVKCSVVLTLVHATFHAHL